MKDQITIMINKQKIKGEELKGRPEERIKKSR
jgi:RNase P/RNase MRP subunit p29